MVRSLVSALAVALVAASVASTASAANVATPKMEQVASWAAGKPVNVYCSDSTEEWQTLAQNPRARGFAYVGGDTAYLSPAVCLPLRAGITDPGFPGALMVLLHEATHARGWDDEALTECAARVLIYSALHDHYGIPWRSARLHGLIAAALRDSFGAGPEYQNGCLRL